LYNFINEELWFPLQVEVGGAPKPDLKQYHSLWTCMHSYYNSSVAPSV